MTDLQRLQPGMTLGGFQVRQVAPLEALNLTLIRLEHAATGAKWIHLANQDDNNLFGVAFPTTPQDSTGVAHILEHTALCGSERFPVRDPFFSMIKRSLNSFMNAFTASDWTMYPFATQNQQDFDNLLQVYLDAAFFPRLTELNFSQEGHRLEFANPEDPQSKLEYKGVVYNEMKGAMSQQASIMHRSLGKALFPTLTYRHNSGGEPSEIVKLTWNDLKAFHQTHYHPSNAFFYTYGDQDPARHAARFEELVLQRFAKIDPHTALNREQRFTSPRQEECTYPLHADEDDGAKAQALVAWLTCEVNEADQVLALQLINLILLGSSGAPLRKALLESNLGKALADGTGFEDEVKECYFAAGLQGVKPENAHQVQELVLTTLQEVVKQGIGQEEIETALHQMEMDTREISGGHYPYGLSLLFRFFGTWMHGGDPVQSLDFDGQVLALRQRLNQKGYLESVIQTQLLNNPHRVLLILKPDHDQANREEQAEQARLATLRQTLTPAEEERIKAQAQALQQLQEEEEDLSCLPTLQLSDIPKEVKHLQPSLQGLGGRDVKLYEQPTNGILYLHCSFGLPALSEQELQWLPLMGYLLTNCGAGSHSYDQFSQLAARHTGGFSLSPSHVRFSSKAGYLHDLVFKSKALGREIPQFFALANLLLTQWRLDEGERIHSLVKQRANQLETSILGSGHHYAMAMASRGFTPGTRLEELQGGIHQVQLMKSLAKLDRPALLAALEPFGDLLRRLLRADNLSIFAVGTPPDLLAAQAEILSLYQALPAGAAAACTDLGLLPGLTPNEAWTTTTPVNYVAESCHAPSQQDPAAPVFQVLATLVKAAFLHGEVREKGGAYGGMASYQMAEGVLSFVSYRDPQLSRTLEVYNKAKQWLAQGRFTEEQLTEAILQTLSNLDTPLSPAATAAREYGMARRGRSLAERQAFRNGLLSVTKAQVQEAAKQWLLGESCKAVITSSEALGKEREKLSASWLEKTI